MVFLINFTMNSPGHDYQPLAGAITQQGYHCQCLDSSWLVDTTRKTHQVLEALTPHLGPNDGMIVAEVNIHTTLGRLPAPAIEWLEHQKNMRR